MLASLSRIALTLIVAALLMLLQGCSNLRQAGFGERDLYVLNTPVDYPDNRVFYVGRLDQDSGTSSVTPSWKLSSEQLGTALKNGQPMSIVIDAVGLPVSNDAKKRDIAVVLDLQAESHSEFRSLVVWYQRDVNAGQTLNFKNLLIYSQEHWDERVAPLFRIRVVDVATERNLETRETLGQVSKFGASLGALIKNPLAQTAIETATRAASLVFSNGSNKVMMDYTVQFFDARLVAGNSAPNLTPLLAGRFVLAGRSAASLSDENFWRRTGSFDEYNTIVRFADVGNLPAAARSPAVSLQIFARELLVQNQVAARSAYLSKLLTEAATTNVEELRIQASTLLAEVDMIAYREQIVRYRQLTSITSLVSLMFRKDAKDVLVMPPTARESAATFLRRLSGCPSIETEQIEAWWNKVKNDKVAFKTNDDIGSDTSGVLLKRVGNSVCSV